MFALCVHNDVINIFFINILSLFFSFTTQSQILVFSILKLFCLSFFAAGKIRGIIPYQPQYQKYEESPVGEEDLLPAIPVADLTTQVRYKSIFH